MKFQPHELAQLRRAHLQVSPRSPGRKSNLSVVAEVAVAALVASFIAVLVLLAERELKSSVILVALWAAPLALLPRSLGQSAAAFVAVSVAFCLSIAFGQTRSMADVAAFFGSGVIFFAAAFFMYARITAQRIKDHRDLEVMTTAHCAAVSALETSSEPAVWLDADNDWIYCNPAALLATGISRISLLQDMGGRAENEAMQGMMHSGSRDAWRYLVEVLNSKRANDEDDDPDSFSPNSRLFSAVENGNVIETRIKLTDALGVSTLYDLRATMLPGEGVMIHGRPVQNAWSTSASNNSGLPR